MKKHRMGFYYSTEQPDYCKDVNEWAALKKNLLKYQFC